MNHDKTTLLHIEDYKARPELTKFFLGEPMPESSIDAIIDEYEHDNELNARHNKKWEAVLKESKQHLHYLGVDQGIDTCHHYGFEGSLENFLEDTYVATAVRLACISMKGLRNSSISVVVHFGKNNHVFLNNISPDLSDIKGPITDPSNIIELSKQAFAP